MLTEIENPTPHTFATKRSCFGFTALAVMTALLIGPAALATEAEPAPAETDASLIETWDDPIEDAMAKVNEYALDGKFDINFRLRFENVHDQGVGGAGKFGNGHATTGRLRLGYTSAEIEGFSFRVDMEEVFTTSDSKYNDTTNGNIAFPVIADPNGTELNQLYGQYNGHGFQARVGRQRIILDDARFVGNVGWRQDEQTFDAATVKFTGSEDMLEGVTAYYGYIDKVNRIFAETGDFTDSDSHIVNVSYDGLDFAKVTGFAYLLDFTGSGAAGAAVVNSNTYGVRVAGNYDIDEEYSLGYIGSYAYQNEAGIATGFEADYYLVDLSVKSKEYGVTVGGGYEVLGSDGGMYGFATPLATLHKFNGWADRFLVTPATGLEDAYVYVAGTLPWEIKAKAIYHHFFSEFGNAEVGKEFDIVLKKKLSDNVSVLTKFAYYLTDTPGTAGAAADVNKLWFQIDFKY